jgi:hypothetical protein
MVIVCFVSKNVKNTLCKTVLVLHTSCMYVHRLQYCVTNVGKKKFRTTVAGVMETKVQTWPMCFFTSFATRVTWCVCEKMAKMSPKPFLWKLKHTYFTCGKCWPNYWGYIGNLQKKVVVHRKAKIRPIWSPCLQRNMTQF